MTDFATSYDMSSRTISTMFSPTTSNMPSSLGIQITLQDLNDEEAMRRLAPMIYLGILILIGLPGNIIVIVTYLTHYKKSTHRIIILGLAWIDLVACVVCMPFEIIEMNFQYTFYAEIACKIFRFNNTFISLGSVLTIVVMAIDRFRRVCRPLQAQMTIKYAKIICMAALVVSAFLSWPSLVYLGIRTVQLKHNITGIDCSISDAFWKTKYPFYHNAVLFLVFIICLVSLVIIYAMIGRRIFSHVKFRSRFVSSRSTSSARTTSTTTGSQRSAQAQFQLLPNPQGEGQNTEDNIAMTAKEESKTNKNEIDKTQKELRKTRKITKIAFLITLMLVLSYLPHLILVIMTAVKGRFLAKPGPIVSALLPIVSRSIFINNMVNPLIYGFCDKKFRTIVSQNICRFCGCFYRRKKF